MEKYLVTGGSGKFSQLVIKALLEDFNISANQIITTTRNKTNLSELSAIGVDVREASFDDINSLREAFVGATKLLIVSTDAIGNRIPQHQNAMQSAKEANVAHISYTSMTNTDISPVAFAFEHIESEAYLKELDFPSYTILRNNCYCENLIEYYGDIFKTSHWLNATGEGKFSYISKKDLAYGAAYDLVHSKKEKKTIDLSGSEALSINAMITIFKDVLGKEITPVTVDVDTYKAELAKFGLPNELIGLLSSFEEHYSKDLANVSSSDFESLTGKKPNTFKSWLATNKEVILSLK